MASCPIFWTDGPARPSPKLTRGHAALRMGGDTDTAADWNIEPPGRSKMSEVSYRVSVEPFTAPEEARDRVLREISLASFSLKVAIYEMIDPGVVAALCQRAGEGVLVEVLVEGQPVAGISDGCSAALSFLSSGGCDVRILSSNEGYKRYDYLHCKYLVSDERRTLVMTENWAGGLVQNRGWGAVCDGRELARYMAAMFDDDFDGSLDVKEIGPGAVPDFTAVHC